VRRLRGDFSRGVGATRPPKVEKTIAPRGRGFAQLTGFVGLSWMGPQHWNRQEIEDRNTERARRGESETWFFYRSSCRLVRPHITGTKLWSWEERESGHLSSVRQRGERKSLIARRKRIIRGKTWSSSNCAFAVGKNLAAGGGQSGVQIS